jgi:DNA-binding GntR family transcriptional regulator
LNGGLCHGRRSPEPTQTDSIEAPCDSVRFNEKAGLTISKAHPERASEKRRGRPRAGDGSIRRARRLVEPAGSRAFDQPPPEQDPGEGLGEYAYRVMREAIRSGKFVPGEHLREADIGRWLDISRTPVREAFHRIVSEGLLTVGPWNGVMVADLNRQQIAELYAVREVLEGTAARLAAQHASPAEVQLLYSIIESESEARHDPEKLVAINAELHQTIYNAAHNRYLLQAITSVVDSLGLLRHSTFVLPGSIEQARREHVDIVRAIKAGDAKRAERVAKLHIQHALGLRLQLLRTTNGGR